MTTDITYCVTIDCPLRAKCRRGDIPPKKEVSLAVFKWTTETWATTIITTCRDILRK